MHMVQMPQNTNVRRLWILIHRRGSWKTGNLIEINALFEHLRDLDPLPRAYHVFEWLSNVKLPMLTVNTVTARPSHLRVRESRRAPGEIFAP